MKIKPRRYMVSALLLGGIAMSFGLGALQDIYAMVYPHSTGLWADLVLDLACTVIYAHWAYKDYQKLYPAKKPVPAFNKTVAQLIMELELAGRPKPAYQTGDRVKVVGNYCDGDDEYAKPGTEFIVLASEWVDTIIPAQYMYIADVRCGPEVFALEQDLELVRDPVCLLEVTI